MLHKPETSVNKEVANLNKPEGCGMWLEITKERPPIFFDSQLHSRALVKANDGCDVCPYFQASKRSIGATALSVQSARQELIRKENEKIDKYCPLGKQTTT